MATEQITVNERRDVAANRLLSGLMQMERMFDDLMVGPSRRFGLADWWRRRDLIPRQPAVEISEDKNEVIVKADIPGLKREDLHVNLGDNVLTISGEREEEREKKENGYYYSERSYGRFSRSIQLPMDVKSDKVSAHFKDGVLDIRLPKTEQAKQREVTIKVD